MVGGSDLNLPEIKIGPYNPWRWDSKLLTSLEQHQPLIKAHPGSSKHFPRHQARYETNITVDPHRVKVNFSFCHVLLSSSGSFLNSHIVYKPHLVCPPPHGQVKVR